MNYKYPFTVFTATYNRKEMLNRLYEDLKNQTFKNFEWLIVDDGSNDGTKEVIEKWINEKSINIRYIYKSNGGKHTAINVGATHARGDLFFLVDSDDRLMVNGLELVLNAWNSISDQAEFCGVTGLSRYRDGEIVGTEFNPNFMEVPFEDLYHKYHVKGDKAVCFKTDIMKEYSFPESEGIMFVMEAVVWGEISKKYKVKCINEVIQIIEYFDDGLSKNTYNEKFIKGLAFSFLTIVNNNTYPFKKFTKFWFYKYIHFTSNSLLADVNYFNQINRKVDKLMYLIFLPRGYIAYLRMRKRVVKDNLN